jgi:hypothetical protein
MNCPRNLCGQRAELVASGAGPHATQRRSYRCAAGHKFSTVEVYEPQDPTIERKALSNVLRAIKEKLHA